MLDRFFLFLGDLWAKAWIRLIVYGLIVAGGLWMLVDVLPLVARVYLGLLMTAWNESIVQLFNLPLMNLGQANALSMLCILVVMPLAGLAVFVRSITK